MEGFFDNTMRVLGNSLDLRAARHKLLSSNIANQETPGYRAVDLKFEDEMRKRDGGIVQGGILLRTSPGHIIPAALRSGQPAVVDRSTEIEGYDRNSVGIDTEMMKLAENSLMYSVSSKMLKGKFNTLMTAIKEGR